MSISKIIDWHKTFQKESVSSPSHSDLVSENEIGLSKQQQQWSVCQTHGERVIMFEK